MMSQKTKQNYKLFLQWFGFVNLILLVPSILFGIHIGHLVNICVNNIK